MSEAINPYAAPRAEVADIYEDGSDTQPVRFFSARGRIGRLRMLCYSTVGYFAFSIVIGVIFALIGPLIKNGAIAPILPMLIVIPYLVFYVLVLIQRSHDMGWSGWTVFFCFIPLVALVWVFNPGTRGVNRYGAPPPRNHWGIVVGAFAVPVLIGIIAAIAIPAYQSYVAKSKTMQLQKP